jgi:hypothetical protein
MPDFAMCLNKECGLNDSCYRFNAPPDRLSQFYEDFSQDDEGGCDHYIEMDKDGIFDLRIDE